MADNHSCFIYITRIHYSICGPAEVSSTADQMPFVKPVARSEIKLERNTETFFRLVSASLAYFQHINKYNNEAKTSLTVCDLFQFHFRMCDRINAKQKQCTQQVNMNGFGHTPRLVTELFLSPLLMFGSLPQHVTSSHSVAVFWSHLKTHLFSISKLSY